MRPRPNTSFDFLEKPTMHLNDSGSIAEWVNRLTYFLAQ